jgi:hypothetical protein
MYKNGYQEKKKFGANYETSNKSTKFSVLCVCGAQDSFFFLRDIVNYSNHFDCTANVTRRKKKRKPNHGRAIQKGEKIIKQVSVCVCFFFRGATKKRTGWF